MYDHNLDDYGYYQLGNARYFNKVQAILDSDRCQWPLRWNYLDQEFDQHDWTQEPDVSLEDLYAARARDIRERYDYLVLHFSGGSDSCNVLETFIRAGVHLDEVLIRGSYSQVPHHRGVIAAEHGYGECISQAMPLAQWVRDNHMPHLRITLVDTTKIMLDYFGRNPDWVEHSGTILTPSFGWKACLDGISPHYRELTERGQRVAHIYGADKPNIRRRGAIFYTQWADNQVGMFAAQRNSLIDSPLHIELFYWGRRTIPLQIKQLHVLKNHIKQHATPEILFDATQASQLGLDQGTAGRHSENYKASVLYRRTLPLLTEPLKPAGSLISAVDAWFARDPYDPAYLNYQRGIEYLNTLLPRNWIPDQGLWSHTGINAMVSRPRYIGT